MRTGSPNDPGADPTRASMTDPDHTPTTDQTSPPGEPGGDVAARRRLRLVSIALVAAVIPGLLWLARHNRADSWWLIVCLAALMLVAELLPIDVELRHESHSFSFSKVPIVIGVFLVSPIAVVVARILSSLIVLKGVHRQPAGKLLVNLVAHTVEVMVAATLVILWQPGGRFGPAEWIVALVAVTAADIVAALVISIAISVTQGRWDPGLLPGVVTGLVAGTADVAIAILMVTMIELRQPALWVVLGVGALMVLLSRAYSRLNARHRSLLLLDRFSRAIGEAVLGGRVVQALLGEAADILHADHAWLVIADSTGIQRVVSDGSVREARPLDLALVERLGSTPTLEQAGGPLGVEMVAAGVTEVIFCHVSAVEDRTIVLAVADRSGTVRPFDETDAALLGTLAVHVGLALLNVDLVDQLRDEVAVTEFQAMHDSLTTLPNRVLFHRELHGALERGLLPSVLLIDLDRFKDVNDTLGHLNGDQLLVEIGRRLRDCLGEPHTVARLGGDEFAAMLVGVPSEEEVLDVAYRLAEELERPVLVAGVEAEVGASIGVAHAGPDNSCDASTLLRQADVAMYTAKSDRSVVEVYSSDRDNYSPQRLSLVGQLRAAIEQGELVLNYQPQIDMRTGAVIGAEALVRWPQPDRAPIPPDEFIYIAEHTGLIRPLTRLVLDLAVSQAGRWYRQGRDMRVSVNLSPHNLVEPGIVDAISAAIRAEGLPADRLMVELTETTVMANPSRTLGVISDIRDLGVGLAIDDFGTGHSSLAYLTRLPATEIKIDKSFVLAMESDAAADSIVRSIVDLARNLGLGAIAEGVETGSVAQSLTRMGCNLGQGYFYSRPLDARAFEHWHAAHDAGRRRLSTAAATAAAAR